MQQPEEDQLTNSNKQQLTPEAQAEQDPEPEEELPLLQRLRHLY